MMACRSSARNPDTNINPFPKVPQDGDPSSSIRHKVPVYRDLTFTKYSRAKVETLSFPEAHPYRYSVCSRQGRKSTRKQISMFRFPPWRMPSKIFGFDSQFWALGSEPGFLDFPQLPYGVKLPSIAIWCQKIKVFLGSHIFARFINKCLGGWSRRAALLEFAFSWGPLCISNGGHARDMSFR